MQNFVIINNDFSSTKYGLSVIAVIVSLLFLVSFTPIGLILILLSVTMIFFELGIEFDVEREQYRHFKSYFGYKTGAWQELNDFKAQIILKKN